jgi:c-di-GMP-binding flagellar brake protein YcgR
MKIADLGLPINLPMRLYLTSDREQFLSVKLIGVLEGKSLIVSAPVTEDNKVVILQQNQGFALNFVWKDTIFTCQTSVLVKQSQPVNHYHLACPNSLNMHEIRANPRVNTTLDVHVINISESQGTLSAIVTDLSAGGLKVQSTTELGMINDYIGVSMRLDIHQIRKNVKLKCQICSMSIKNEESVRSYSYGVKVVEGEQDEMIALNGFVYQCKLESLKVI